MNLSLLKRGGDQVEISASWEFANLFYLCFVMASTSILYHSANKYPDNLIIPSEKKRNKHPRRRFNFESLVKFISHPLSIQPFLDQFLFYDRNRVFRSSSGKSDNLFASIETYQCVTVDISCTTSGSLSGILCFSLSLFLLLSYQYLNLIIKFNTLTFEFNN